MIGSTNRPLQRCGGCQLIPYCSKDCQKDDRPSHREFCREFPVSNGKNALHTEGPWEEHIKHLRQRASQLPNAECVATPLFVEPWSCHTCHETSPNRLTTCKCGVVCHCSKKCARADRLHKKRCNPLSELMKAVSMNYVRLGYPYSLLFALEMIPNGLVGVDNVAVENLTSLNIHLVMTKAMWDSVAEDEFFMRLLWQEGFARAFCRMEVLCLTFILQTTVNPYFTLTPLVVQPKCPSGRECRKCEVRKPRVTHYAIHQMKYHMYCSSETYTTPDIVVVYGNTQSMPVSEKETLHTEISYRNMIHNPNTIVILMDATKELVEQGINTISTIHPLEVLLETQINPFRKCTADPTMANDKFYVASLRKKQPCRRS